MSAADACDRFQQHTWRKDTCANCLKPHKLHSPTGANPQPAKRLSKTSTARDTSPVVLDRDETTQAIDEGQMESQTESGQERARQASGPDAKRLSVVGSPKPAPIKAKPLIVLKPEKAKKPGVVVDGGEKTGTAKKIAEDPGSQDVSSTSDITREAAAPKQDVRPAARDNHSETSDGVEVDREPVSTTQKTTKARPRPQVTPPQVPDPGKIPNNASTKSSTAKSSDVKSSATAKPSAVNAKSSGSHYYQIYDISAKGLSGTPEPVDIPEQNGVSEVGKGNDCRGMRGSVCRVVDVVDEPQNVAMPYTVVDVTLCQPNKEQLMSRAPPQLPLTPAPIRDSGATSAAQNNTLPANRPWSTRDGNDFVRNSTLSSVPNSANVSADPCPGETSSALRGNALLPLDGKFLVGKMANQDLYEDIASSSPSLNSEINSTSSVVKSGALEAKMAALSKLDLSRGIAPQQGASSTLPARTDDSRLDTLTAASGGDKQQDPGETEMKSGDVVTVITLNRQEKGRKSGGKSSFFQKFLKRGNKDTTSDVVAQSKTSPLSITIEPILNTTPPPSLGQSSLITKGSSDSTLNSSSPSRMSSSKSPLLPAASPAKKSTNDAPGEAGESSANSSVSSSEDSGRIAEKTTFEPSSEKPDKEDSISGDLPKVLPVKSSSSSSSSSVDRTQSAKSIFLNDVAPKDVVTNPTRDSLTAARDKLKSNLTRIPDGTKLVEDKTAFAESLRDALALRMNEKDTAAGVGKDAVLDSSPTTDGADHSLNSAKSELQKDVLKPGKAPRKMMAPPPMAPPPPPPSSVSSRDQDMNLSSPKHSGALAAETDHPPSGQRCLSPSLQGSLTLAGRRVKPGDSVRNAALTFPLSSTLPRKSSSTASSANATGIKVAAGSVGLRQLDSAAKHARNKTVSEGVRFEKMVIAPEEGDEKKRSENALTVSETLERRASKFLNRALPAPPPNESPPSDTDNCLDEIDNLYELVSQSDSTTEKNCNEQLTYEDIDLYCAKTNNGSGSKTSSTSSSQRSTSLQTTNQKQGTSSSDPLASPSSGYYLEPVGGKEDSNARGIRGGVKDDWRPCPAPRGSLPPSKGMVGSEQTAAGAMSYVNTRMINGQLPLNTSDGFDAMAGLIVNMLYHLSDRLYTTYITRFLKNRADVFWTDFELVDFTPRIVQEMASFYQAKHLVLAPSGCILMVSKESPGSSVSLEPMQANVISPLLCFAMTATDLETLNGCTTAETVATPRNATAAVLLCSDVATLDSFWAREHDKTLDESSTIVFEQSVCLCFVQILNALLYLRDSGCTVLRLSSDDVIMARLSDCKWHPLVKPSVMTFDICSDHDSAFLGEDVTQLLFHMLRTESGKTDRQETKVVVPRTRYSRGLQRVVRLMVASRTWEGLEMGRNLLEFILWGPSEEEAKFVAMTDKRDTSFRVWLEVARCRMASELVLELERHNLELANQAKFLCRVTENSLLGVTKLLFE